MNERPRIAVVGSANMDLVTMTPRMPRIGETLEARDFFTGYGGKGANQAIAAARLGAEVVMVARIGDDMFGAEMRRNFEENGVDASHVKVVEGCPTGVAAISVDDDGNNCIMIVKGANGRLLPADVENAARSLRGCGMMLLQLEIPVETVYAAIRLAVGEGVPVLLNPAPGMRLEAEYLRMVDFLAPNETELEIITGMPAAGPDDALAAARRLVEGGVRRVIVTLGEKGSLYVDERGHLLADPLPVSPVDTTGAGDAFIGGFAFYYLRTGDVGEAMRMANRYAAISTMKRGTQSSFAPMDEFMRTLGGLEASASAKKCSE